MYIPWPRHSVLEKSLHKGQLWNMFIEYSMWGKYPNIDTVVVVATITMHFTEVNYAAHPLYCFVFNVLLATTLLSSGP